MQGAILAIDQGTTSSRALIFSPDFQVRAAAQEEFPQHYPHAGWVEHDPEDLWDTSLRTARAAMAKAGLTAGEVAAIGITNQRETTLIWERASGRAIHPAIVWQDRRTAAACHRMRAEGQEPLVAARSGLLLDPYFSASKIAWILETVEGARDRAARGELAFGTVDSFLLWRLTGGRVHATDATNAARTLLFNIETQEWDAELLKLFGIPEALLPEVRDCNAHFGESDPAFFGGAIPILGIAGDQQAATVGQAAFEPGMAKSTYGTGCFALMNTGSDRVPSRNRLLTTVAYRLDGQVSYALEGAIFVAGAAVQWLRDGLGIVETAAESGSLAAAADPELQVTLVPAFVGLGAPYWDPDARGAIYGLSRGVGRAEIARAALESVCFQTHDLIVAMQKDWQSGEGLTQLRVDGGMVASDWTMQRLADILDVPVDRPRVLETTALGAAWLAGHKAGVWPGQADFAKAWHLERRFTPAMPTKERQQDLARWADAVRRTRSDLSV